MDYEDVENNKPNQKTDRQILFIFAAIVWIGETIMDMFKAPEKPKKKKSIIGGSKKKTESEKEETKNTDSAKKSKREKIE